MPTTTQNKKNASSALAKNDQWADPFTEYGEASTQLHIKIPVAKIEYLASKETQRKHPEWQKGKFSLSIGEQIDHLEANLVGLRYGRVCFLDEFDPNNPNVDPDCKSDNGIVPSPCIDHPLTDQLCTINGDKVNVCAHCDDNGIPARNRAGKYLVACSYAQWSDRKTPPKCHDFFTLLLWEHQLNLPLIFNVKGTGIKHLDQLHMDMIRAIREIPDDSTYPASCYIRIDIRAMAVSNWYEPQFKIVQPFSDDEAWFNAEARRKLVESFHSMNADDFSFDKAEEND